MRKHITGIRVSTKIHMLRQLGYSNFLVVEGEADRRFFEKFVDKQKCVIEIADSKNNVLEAVTIFNTQNFSGVLGIVDSDFWKIENAEPILENIICTDTHDLETMLLQSSALENTIAEYGDRAMLDSFLKKSNKKLRDVLLNNSEVIGSLRWFSLKNNIGLSFKDLDFYKFIDLKTLQLCFNLLILEIKSKSQRNVNIEELDLAMEVKNIINKDYDKWQISCGHDIVKILLIGFKCIFGADNSKHLMKGSLEGSLRLGYSYENFIQTNIFKFIKLWEQKNGCCILNDSEINTKAS